MSEHPVTRNTRRLTVAALGLALSMTAAARAQGEFGILATGDAVVTGFSGVIEPAPRDPPLDPATLIDETLIDPEGISARINYLGAPGHVWDARVWPAARALELRARDIGQVFGVAIDDAEFPNIYLAASSAYGLHIVAPDKDGDGRPERLRAGSPEAMWMEGLWGTPNANDASGRLGGPGSIWKVDGRTGEVTLFANVEHDGEANPGAGLGNIVYAGEQKALFVSDLATGLIHRYDLLGAETGLFDHGVIGRSSAGLESVFHDPEARLDIASGDFDPGDAETWGMTDEDRRIHGLAWHDGRLFYAVAGGSQVWSVGFDEKTGDFLAEARWELDVPEKPKALPVTDMLFTRMGALVLAQRGEPASLYDYSGLAAHGKARVYRYWLESPDDPRTESRWIAEPQEYAVGFEAANRQTSGGLALNHGYTADGYLDPAVCEASLWTTGDDLRRTAVDDLVRALTPGGLLEIDGLQGMPAGPVKSDGGAGNTPPWASYMLDNDPDNSGLIDMFARPSRWSDARTEGWIGDVEILTGDCDAIAGGGGGYWGGAGYAWSNPDYVDPEGDGDGGEDKQCTPGKDCPASACANPSGKLVCDTTTGQWTYLMALDPAELAGLGADTVKITGTSPGVSVAGGPLLPVGAITPMPLTIAGGGQLATIGLCLFNKAEMQSGKPFTCCKTAVTARVPAGDCRKQN
ncbi:MAG: hypothetical protein WAT70_13830 [Rhizobiaceae bacterium]